MSEPRDDYRDIDRPPDAAPKPDPTGLRPHDRVQIVGWAGLFMALAPGIVALAYLGRPETWMAREAAIAFGLAGLLTGVYVVAGGLLVIRGALSKPIHGDAVRYFNLLIVSPILALATLVVVYPYVLVLIAIFQSRRLDPLALLLVVALVPLFIVEIVPLIRNRRRIIPALRAWLDPTE
jgi:hypothetical protein